MTILSTRLKTKVNYYPEGLEGHGDTYQAIGKTDHSVYSMDSFMVRGANKHSGKTYCRFQPNSLVSYSWKSGRLRVFRKSWVRERGGNRRYRIQIEDQTDYVLRDGRYSLSDEVLPALLDFSGKSSFSELILSEYPLLRDLAPARDVTPFLTRSNIQDFTRDFFGPSRYRKDLVRGVAQRGWAIDGGMRSLVIAKAFAPMVPTDWIARKFLDAPEPTMYRLANRINDSSPYGYREIRQMLRTATPKQIRRLWNTEARKVFNDTMRLWKLIRQVDDGYRLEEVAFTDWKTLHDQLAIDQRRIHTRNRKVEYKDKAAEVIGTFHTLQWPEGGVAAAMAAPNEGIPEVAFQTETYEIVGTPDTHTLLEWGNSMGNCIGGYQDDAVHGGSLLYAVLKDDKMIANVEVSPTGTLRQLVGKYNATLPREDHDPIVEAFKRVWPHCADGHYTGKLQPAVPLGDADRPRDYLRYWQQPRRDVDGLPEWIAV